MKFRYFYQQIVSHISIIIVAFLVLSLLFAHYVETLVYTNKTEELSDYGKNIIRDLEQSRNGGDRVLNEYSHVLEGRNIQYMVFDEKGQIIYPTGGRIILKEEEWNKIKAGQTVTVTQEMKRFNQAVTFILLPYIQSGEFIGGIFLASPISGSREMISQINQYLWYAVLIALIVALLLSWLLSKVHVNRIKRLQEATSLSICRRLYCKTAIVLILMKSVN